VQQTMTAAEVQCTQGLPLLSNAHQTSPTKSTAADVAVQACRRSKLQATGLLHRHAVSATSCEKQHQHWLLTSMRPAAPRLPGGGAAGGGSVQQLQHCRLRCCQAARGCLPSCGALQQVGAHLRGGGGLWPCGLGCTSAFPVQWDLHQADHLPVTSCTCIPYSHLEGFEQQATHYIAESCYSPVQDHDNAGNMLPTPSRLLVLQSICCPPLHGSSHYSQYAAHPLMPPPTAGKNLAAAQNERQ
jgi:hypothetical protein